MFRDVSLDLTSDMIINRECYFVFACVQCTSSRQAHFWRYIVTLMSVSLRLHSIQSSKKPSYQIWIQYWEKCAYLYGLMQTIDKGTRRKLKGVYHIFYPSGLARHCSASYNSRSLVSGLIFSEREVSASQGSVLISKLYFGGSLSPIVPESIRTKFVSSW